MAAILADNQIKCGVQFVVYLAWSLVPLDVHGAAVSLWSWPQYFMDYRDA